MKKERGKVYFSVEWFRSLPQGFDFSLVHEIARALEMPDDVIHFDFSTVPRERALRSPPLGEGTLSCKAIRLRQSGNDPPLVGVSGFLFGKLWFKLLFCPLRHERGL